MTSSIFDALSPAEAAQVRAAGTQLTLPAGWSPIGERTPADKAYILTAGEVSVRRNGTEIAQLGPGQIIGEAAIVNHTLRSATIVALTPLEAIHFTSAKLEELVARIPAFADALTRAAAERLESGSAPE
ncbi:Crp/Fnr family transcriptional regulator [Nocardioides currus]|uniref:Cyclic nucleotide-binding domain-containing protein n=1 Tax=Nocardioides currus TaxID=2133958 RepID=A0A2R7Z340_9ACTN|nr:cyclic nucleotide-binding domain-containing protein [Nocardioides currus]PUA82974.1 cyclic nucleotide-binding domain-containing protein [Nocardioides currus]